MTEKYKLRKYINEKLRLLDSERLDKSSELICNKLIELFKNKNFKNVLVYIKILDEPNLSNFIKHLQSQNIEIYIPVILWDYLIPSEYSEELELWAYWTRQPISKKFYHWELDCILLPWIAFTMDWKRLWRWWWFYDRFLVNYPNSFKVWICYDFQIFSEVPFESFDVQMDYVITN